MRAKTARVSPLTSVKGQANHAATTSTPCAGRHHRCSPVVRRGQDSRETSRVETTLFYRAIYIVPTARHAAFISADQFKRRFARAALDSN